MAGFEDGIVARGVVRRFGDFQALGGLDLTAPYGEVTALVGPNGAGKTTLLLILATLLAPDEGDVWVAGCDVRADPVRARSRLGWMPDTFGMYDQLTAGEYLSFFADAYRIPPEEAADRVSGLLGQVHLNEYASRPVHVLSRGQKQRLGLARALIHHPEVLLLDEPASGLDPRSRIDLRDLLRDLAGSGVAVLVSSHILSELEEIADRVVLVDHGKSAGEHTMRALTEGARSPWRIRAADPLGLIEALDRRGIDHGGMNVAGLELAPMTEEGAADLLAELIGDRVRVIAYAPAVSGLESAYLAMTEERR